MRARRGVSQAAGIDAVALTLLYYIILCSMLIYSILSYYVILYYIILYDPLFIMHLHDFYTRFVICSQVQCDQHAITYHKSTKCLQMPRCTDLSQAVATRLGLRGASGEAVATTAMPT